MALSLGVLLTACSDSYVADPLPSATPKPTPVATVAPPSPTPTATPDPTPTASPTPEPTPTPVPDLVLGISGKVVAAPAAGALIQASLGEREFQTSTDENGEYMLELSTPVTQDQVPITVSATLAGDRGYVVLLANLGSFADALAAAGENGVLEFAEDLRVNLSSLSTAEAVLIEEAEAQAGKISGKAFAFGAGVNPDDAIRLAGALELLITQPETFPLPEGSATTADLARDSAVRQAFMAELPGDALEDAMYVLSGNTDVVAALDAADLPAELLTATLEIGGEYPWFYYGLVNGFELGANGRGRYVYAVETVDMSWSVQGARVRVTFDAPTRAESSTLADCDGSGQLARHDTIETFSGIDFVLVSPTAVIASRISTVTTPGCPNVPDWTGTVTGGRTLLSDDNLLDLAEADFAGQRYGLKVFGPFQENRGSIGAADILTFRADGTGNGRYIVDEFTWSVANGALLIDYGNGTQGRYRLVKSLDGIASSLLVDWSSPEGRFVDLGYAFKRDSAYTFSADSVAGLWYEFGIGAQNGGDPRRQGRRYEFAEDGRGVSVNDAVDENGELVDLLGTPYFWSVQGGVLVAGSYYQPSTGEICTEQLEPSCVLYQEHLFAPINVDGERIYALQVFRSTADISLPLEVGSAYLKFFDRVPLDANSKATTGISRSATRAMPPQPGIHH